MAAASASPDRSRSKRVALAVGTTTRTAQEMYALVEKQCYGGDHMMDFFKVQPTTTARMPSGVNYRFLCSSRKLEKKKGGASSSSSSTGASAAFASPAAASSRGDENGVDGGDNAVEIDDDSGSHQCGWHVDVSLSRKGGKKGVAQHEVVAFVEEHGTYCLRVAPRPSLQFLLTHSPITAFARAQKPSALLAYAKREFGFDISANMASSVKEAATTSAGSEQDLAYQGIEAYLHAYVALNKDQGARMHYEEDPVTGTFVSAALLFPVASLLANSFLRTVAFNGGFILTKTGVKAQLFMLVGADREHHTVVIAVGVFNAESCENYKTFLGLPMSVPSINAVFSSKDKRCAAIHDRHLSMRPALLEALPEMLDRIDLVHLQRNIRVSLLLVTLLPDLL